MSDLISRSALAEAMETWGGDVESLVEYINDMPTLEAESVVHGEWKNRKKWDRYVCSECSHESKTNSNFCPNCGADMRGGKNGTL